MPLNDQQQGILEFPMDSAALVMAGAGSGKTTVIAHRAVRLSAQIPAGTFLQMLTFSNKAAKEMKARVNRVAVNIGGDIDRIRFDTFHSFGIRLLKDDPAGFGLPDGLSLLNENDVKRSVRLLAKKSGLPKDIPAEDRRRLNPVAWLNTWSLSRQAGYDVRNPANREALCERLIKAHALTKDEVAIAWETLSGYEQEKLGNGVVDFDDLLYLPLLRMARDGNYLESVKKEIGYIMVDEAQDTNRIQYEIIRRIGLGHCGVTCVGDDDQSIYGWRGAEVSNLRRFLVNFSARELRLEQNYRSTQAIVESASRLVRHNEGRLDKSPFSKGERGEIPGLNAFDHSRDMADAIAASISSRIEDGVSPKEIAVLYRTNRMAMLLEQSLRRYGVPYHVVGGMSLFDRAEVLAITSALRVCINPRDAYALKSLTTYIDGFGEASAQGVADWIEENPDCSLQSLPDELPFVSPSRIKALRSFYDDLIFEALSSETVNEFIQWAIHGPMALLDREKDEQLRERRSAHLESLAVDIGEELAERRQAEPKLTWRDVMIEVALRDARQSEAEMGQVTLSTIHRSKGLEWDEVFVAGASEGLMPLDNKSDLADDDAGYSHIEEERRIAYVALTRAKSKCEFYHANRYAFLGSKEDRQYEPSRFLIEMGLSFNCGISEVAEFDDLDNAVFDQDVFKRALARLSM